MIDTAKLERETGRENKDHP